MAKKNNIRRDAVDVLDFSIAFNEILLNHKNIKWVKFHGLYGFAYLRRLLGREDCQIRFRSSWSCLHMFLDLCTMSSTWLDFAKG